MALPAERRLRRGADITAAVRRGSRARSGGLVVHGLARDHAPDQERLLAGASGPRIAFVAPRAVGNAVVRNRTRRRLQAHLNDLVGSGVLTDDVDLVLRLLPASATTDQPELGRQLRSALRRLGVLDDERS